MEKRILCLVNLFPLQPVVGFSPFVFIQRRIFDTIIQRCQFVSCNLHIQKEIQNTEKHFQNRVTCPLHDGDAVHKSSVFDDMPLLE